MPAIQIENDQLINAARQMPGEELRQLIDQLTRLELERSGTGFAETEAEQMLRSNQNPPSVSSAQNHTTDTAASFVLQAEDDWERMILELGTDCGVSLSDEALSSEGLYE